MGHGIRILNREHAMGKKVLIRFFVFFVSIICLNCELEKPLSEEIRLTESWPQYALEPIDIPEKIVQSPDSMAKKILEYVRFFNSLKMYADMLEIPIDSLDTDPPWQTSWTDEDGFRMNLVLNYSEAEEMYSWRLTKNGIDSATGTVYDNWTAIAATIDRSRFISNFYIYDKNCPGYKISARIKYLPAGTTTYSIYTRELPLPWVFRISYNPTFYQAVGDFRAVGRLYFPVEGFGYELYWNYRGDGIWFKTDDLDWVVDSGEW